MTKHIVVDDDVHMNLNTLKGILGFKNLNDVIISLMLSRKYSDAFFERIQEKINDE